MSKISLKHSGGNVVSLNSPTSAPTSADVAFKLPNADGSNGQYMKTDGSGNLSFGTISIPAGGKVLKHYYNFYDTSTSMGGASSYSMYGGLVATFTPSAAGSLLLVTMVQAGQHIITSDPDVSMKYRIKRTIASGTETDIYEIDYVADRATSNARHFHHVPMTILDNPTYNLGESIVYKPFISKYTANYGTTYQAQYGDTRSHVTILELAANT